MEQWVAVQLHRIANGPLTVVVDTTAPVPAVVWIGTGPGPDLAHLSTLIGRPTAASSLAREAPLTLVPTAASGFPGRPGIEGHRNDASAAFPVFTSGSHETDDDSLRFRAVDDDAGLELVGSLSVGDLVEVELALTNRGDQPYHLARLTATLPVADGASEILGLGGHWCHEFQARRRAWDGEPHVVESRRGRTSHSSAPTVFAGPAGFGEGHGSVLGGHLAWSGNHELRVERLADGRGLLQLGELLLPGEVVLGPGDTYRSPTVLVAAGEGLGAVSRSFHRHLRRSLPEGPRPVLLNTWEAVYFDHDADTLRALADRAAAVGVERFVLDDGWFGGRRDDTAGLGDWWVSPDAHPHGLRPLIDHVTGLGMEFGLWVEPEMVNPDSDLYRMHPDWVLGDPTITARNQLVLDLTNDACWDHLHGQLDRILCDHDIRFLKWDMNRDLVGVGAHHQTLALYRLLDAIVAEHPEVEIESCASGGGRADAGILRRTARVWTSDCNDPLERQSIQRGYSLVFPPETMGAHIGPPRAHTTGRTQRLAFRAATALFGHLGIEWNLLEASDRHLDALAAWIELHKQLRPLLHHGDVVRLDHPDPSGCAHGVVAPGREEAIFAYTQLTTSARTVPPRLVLDGLDPDRAYRVEHLQVPGEIGGMALTQPPWFGHDPVATTGRTLQSIGLQLPVLLPESTVLIRVRSA